MAFKQPPKSNDGYKKIQEDRFIEEARGETSSIESSKPDLKNFLVPLPVDTIELVRKYQKTEGKKIETQGYIVNEAILMWLKSKGFI